MKILTVITFLLLIVPSVILADELVGFNMITSKKLIADFSSCKDNGLVNTKKIGVLGEIIEAEKTRADNLYFQNELCEDSLLIVEAQADEWEKEYTQCIEDSVNCNELPWWKIDFKSAGAGILLTLLLIGL